MSSVPDDQPPRSAREFTPFSPNSTSAPIAICTLPNFLIELGHS